MPVANAPAVEQPKPAPPPVRVEANGRAVIGPSLIMKAQITGVEDLYIDGQVDGGIDLTGHNLTIGAKGRVKANVVARNIFVEGNLEGNVQATEKVEIRKTGSLRGDLTTAGVTIEDGAYFKGSIDIVKASAAAAAPPSKAEKADQGASRGPEVRPAATGVAPGR
jgi:cytoskeletal protein CcmA (bactofilin family)